MHAEQLLYKPVRVGGGVFERGNLLREIVATLPTTSAAWFLPLARMRSEGTVVGSVCLSVFLSVTLHLTPRTSVRPRNDTIYPTGDEGQKIKAVFSENAPLQS